MSEIANARAGRSRGAACRGRKFNEGSFDPDDMPDDGYRATAEHQAVHADPESYRLRSIEDYNDVTGEARKKDIFYRNHPEAQQEPEIKSANDGVLWSLNNLGRFDVDAIAEKMGQDAPTVIAELGDSVFKVPGTRDTYQTKRRIPVRRRVDKLDKRATMAEHDPDVRRNVEALEGASRRRCPIGNLDGARHAVDTDRDVARVSSRDRLELGNPRDPSQRRSPARGSCNDEGRGKALQAPSGAHRSVTPTSC